MINKKYTTKPNSDILFVTDLDGTFLNSEKKVSHKSQRIINSLIKKGLNFSIATARTPATVTQILSKVNINLPIICMNGSAIYSLKEEKFIYYHSLNKSIFSSIISVIKKNNSNCFVYSIKDNQLLVFYDKILNKPQEDFFNERQNLPLKTYVNKIPSDPENPIFLMLLDRTEVINKIYEELLSSDYKQELTISKYYDIYFGKEYSYLEIYDMNASKKSGVAYLKELCQASVVCAFGDNSNDLSMFEMANFSFAVDNGAEDVKNSATKIIGSNNKNSVALEIKKLSTK